MNKFRALLDKNLIFLDGAMGTMLQDGILPAGFLPELLNLTDPEKVTAVHEKYLSAGSDIIYTNTFGANKYKILPPHKAEEVIEAAVKLAIRAAKPYGAAVALDIGSLGKMFMSIDELYDAFVPLVKAGEKAGADLVVFETMSDLAEMRAAVLAAKENTSLPILATMTFEKNARTFLGVSAESFARTITALGVDAIGLNCSLGPEDVLDTVRQLRRNTHLPLAVKPNAGLPDGDGCYHIDYTMFSDFFEEIISEGVQLIGGCCGTSPDFIKKLKSSYKDTIIPSFEMEQKSIICSATKTVDLSKGLLVVGERLNPTGKKKLTAAILEEDLDFLLEQASSQAEDGAEILDVNVGVAGVDEAKTMKLVVQEVQTVTNLPLQIDSSETAAIEAGLRSFNGVAIINSVNGKQSVLDSILPLAQKYGAYVVGLCLDEDGIPQTAEKRVQIAEKIMNEAAKYGIPKHRLIIDCLVLTVSAQQEQAAETLKAVREVREKLGLLTLLGVSNVSYGLPDRPLINSTFLAMAAEAGLNLAILNPSDSEVKRTVAAIRVLSGEDVSSATYISSISQMKKAPAAISQAADPLKDAVIKGLSGEAADLTIEALKTDFAENIIQNTLIPALDIVGELFEKGDFFLPQLIASANAAEAAFSVIKEQYRKSGTEVKGKGTIVLCTVKGDIHDIGKNIVKILLENYGFDVIDLGKDVSKEMVLDAVLSSGAKLVGLSALMTTTVASMEETIAYLRKNAPRVKIMVGGAVLTEEITKRIGADFYSSDAKQGVDIAKKIYA